MIIVKMIFVGCKLSFMTSMDPIDRKIMRLNFIHFIAYKSKIFKLYK